MSSSESKNTRWKVLETGQVVDSTNLAEDIAKMQIGEVAEVDDRLPTSPQGKRTSLVTPGQENSPLETGSDASPGSNSPSRDIGAPHTRESSADTKSSHDSSARHSLKISTGSENDRFGGLHQTGMSASNGILSMTTPIARPQLVSPLVEQPSYASLATHQAKQRHQGPHRPQNLQGHHVPQHSDEFQPSRPFSHQQGLPSFTPGGGRGDVPGMMPYRQPPRAAFSNQPMLVGTPGLPPPNFPYATGHHPHLSISNSQQLYDMMVPDLGAVAAAQQQAFRNGHQHSTSDPSTLRDAATLALMGGGAFPPVGPGMYLPQALSMYTAAAAQPFYPTAQRDTYAQEMARAMQQAAALQPQYTGMSGYESAPQSPPASSTQGGPSNGPSANNRKLGLYKTELCRNWEEKGSCRYGQKCQFAHGEDEVRNVPRHPKYKTEICRTFWVSGSCPYGKRCCFIHTELPSSGPPPGADGTPPPKILDTHSPTAGSGSDLELSLLQRISAQKNQKDGANTPTGTIAPTPKPTSPPSAGLGSMTRPGSLRLDTKSLDLSAGMNQNKSAYPTFAANGVLIHNDPRRSPGPVTAGPEFGQQSRLRGQVVGQRLTSSKSPIDPSVRHSFNGMDVNVITSPLSAAGPGPSFAAGIQTPVPASAVDNSTYSLPRVQGHTRSGSAGNWKGLASRGSHLAPPSPYSHSPSPSETIGNTTPNSAWPPSSELSSNAARSAENKAWI